MKILVLSHSGQIGGATMSLQAVVGDLQKAGCEIDVLSPDGPMTKEWEKKGVGLHHWKAPLCPWLLGPIYSSAVVRFNWVFLPLLVLLPLKCFRAAKMLKRLLLQGSYDRVYLNSLTLFPVAAFLNAIIPKRLERPEVIWHIRELVNPRLFKPVRNWVTRSIMKVSDQIVVITENEAKAFESHKACSVVYNTIPGDWPNKQPAVPQFDDVFNGETRVAMAAALSPAKGLQEFIEMAERLAGELPNVRFELFTPKHPYPFCFRLGTDEATESFMTESLRSVSSIRFGGQTTWNLGHEITPQLFESLHVFVRPDRAGCPWGRDIIEAMWMGLPVVATGSYNGFVEDGVTGFLVEPGKVEALSEKVRLISSDRDLWLRMRKASLERAQQLFAPEKHAAKIRRVFGIES